MDVRAEVWIVTFVALFLIVVASARRRRRPIPWIPLLFFCSGFPALIYQIVWQRALFAIYGINIQSVTIVVSGFMLGLGLGSLVGGALSRNKSIPLVVLFAICELGIGAFGFCSLRLFQWVAGFTAGDSLLVTGLISFGLVVLPTVLMGATLPILVQHWIRASRNVGYSVGLLYFVNTLGSGFACFLTADVLMRLMGQSGAVRLAAAVNLSVGIGGLLVSKYGHRSAEEHGGESQFAETAGQPQSSALSFRLALVCAGLSGLIALSYEMIWFRLLAFATDDTARAFASLLGTYLFGLAAGSRLAEKYLSSHRDQKSAIGTLAWLLLGSATLSFAAAPLAALIFRFAEPNGQSAHAWPLLIVILTIVVAAAFFGATFPVIAHVSITSSRDSGRALSQLYAANIAGATFGTAVVGFILMDHLRTSSVSLLLLIAGYLLALTVYEKCGARRSVASLLVVSTAVVVFVIASQPVLSTMYDRLLFKNKYPALHFQRVVENRNGVIGVTPGGVVWGGGVYDGRFSVDLLHDENIIVRPYAISAFHAAPRRVLMIGLGSGSWAQVVANQPQVEDLTVVEINPGYLELIADYPVVASLLQNPKVHITIDDGRRWLVHHDQSFDLIVMNTTFYWRNHTSNLLSVEFLQIARRHLNPGGVLFYNTTNSEDALATGLSVFRYGLRVVNALAVSDSPLIFDRVRWKTALLNERIDGKPIMDAGDSAQLSKLDVIVNIPEDPTGRVFESIESDAEMRKRLHGRLIITDDNMGLEWR